MYKVNDNLKRLQNTGIKHRMIVDKAQGLIREIQLFINIERELI